MGAELRSLISYGVLAPPNLLIVLCLIGALVDLAWRRTGMVIMLGSSICLFVVATPAFSSYVTTCLEARVPLHEARLSSAEAIVVLGADVRTGGGPDRLGLQSLDNAAMTADAYHQLGLPVAVSGGRLPHWDSSLATLLKSALIRYFGVPVTWVEDKSRNTYENALYTAQMLSQAKIGTVVLVTQARDLPRALWSFEHAGLHALPWPAPRDNLAINQLQDFLPSTTALDDSFYALHELIGMLYYRVQF